MDSNNNFNFNDDWNQPEKKESNSLVKTVRNGVIFGLCAGLIFTGTTYVGNKLTGNSSSSNSTSTTAQIVQTASTSSSTTVYDVATVASEVMPSMVSIDITETVTYNTGSNFFGRGQTYSYEVSGSGSGIIYSQDNDSLYVLTNYHVVEGASTIKCTFTDNQSYDASVVGYDEDNDLALVKVANVSSDTLSNIKVAVFAAEDDLTLGQPCVAIGNALGYGQSVTVGYVSATAREVQTTDSVQTLIQTDAAINPGNSGGALLNMNGEVIGINSAKYSDTDVEGMGFAIPVSTVMEVIPELMSGAKNDTKTVYLGISGTTVTEAYVESFGWPEGVYVSTVVSDSPAQQAGIQAGDVIVGFDDETIASMTELQEAIQKCKVGQSVTITIARQQSNGDFEEVTVTAVLAEKTEEE